MSSRHEYTLATANRADRAVREPQRLDLVERWNSLSVSDNAKEIASDLESIAARYLTDPTPQRIDNETQLTIAANGTVTLDTTDKSVLLQKDLFKARWVQYPTPVANKLAIHQSIFTPDRIELGYYADEEHMEKMRALTIRQRKGLTPRTILISDNVGRIFKYAVYPKADQDQLDPWSLEDTQAIFFQSPVSQADCIAARNAVVAFEAKLFLQELLQSKTQ